MREATNIVSEGRLVGVTAWMIYLTDITQVALRG